MHEIEKCKTSFHIIEKWRTSFHFTVAWVYYADVARASPYRVNLIQRTYMTQIVMSSLFQHGVAMLFWCNSEIYYVLCQLGYTTQHQKGYLI